MSELLEPRCVLTVCPRCDNKPVVDPFQQEADAPCGMCGGVGWIDPEFVCDCGRPALTELHGKPVCMSLECAARVQDAHKTAQTSTVEQDIEDYGWAASWAGMH